MAGCEPTVLDGTQGNAALGVTEFRTTEAPNHLAIEGVDGTGAVIASIELRVGHVDLPEEQLAGMGREMTMRVPGIDGRHASVGLSLIVLPEPEDEPMRLLFRDPYVAATLASWDILTGDAAPSDDANFSHGGDCSGFLPPCGGTPWTTCCLSHADASGNRAQKVVCGNQTPMAVRANRSCKGAWMATACGTAGAGGCAVCSTFSYNPSIQFYWTQYSAGTDACTFGSCLLTGAMCVQGWQCCSGVCELDLNVGDYLCQ